MHSSCLSDDALIKLFFLCLGGLFRLHLVENGQHIQMYRKRFFPLDKSHPGARTHVLHFVKQCFFFIGCLKDVQHRAEKKTERWKLPSVCCTEDCKPEWSGGRFWFFFFFSKLQLPKLYLLILTKTQKVFRKKLEQKNTCLSKEVCKLATRDDSR